MDWKKAEKRLKTIRGLYTEIGVSGLSALQIVINPLLIKFEKGERTQELYNNIMSLKE